MKNFRNSLNEEMNNSDFVKEWHALDAEFNRIRDSLRSDYSTVPLVTNNTVKNFRVVKSVLNNHIPTANA